MEKKKYLERVLIAPEAATHTFSSKNRDSKVFSPLSL
jgi:hypothetical protein